ncbi:MAG TPA: S8/S53 family peptidase [Streptosporangiaceae bacterium]|jgi:subtilisin family serine protease|nr:S8/S53 family peptidase [Streptosporangiaceae bacterium]
MAGNSEAVAAFAAEERARAENRQRLVPETQSALKLDPDVRAWPLNWEHDRHVEYFYRSKSLLARDRDLQRVLDALRSLGALPDDANSFGSSGGADDHALIAGISRLDVQVRDSQHTPDVVADLDRRLGVGVATHEHAFVITPNTICPATEPEAVITPQQAEDPALVEAALWPAIGDLSAGTDVRVSVIDTGLLDGASGWARWIQGVEPDTRADIEDPERIRKGFADPYAGHGTFVSGVIRCLAPASHVVVEREIEVSGFVRESSLIKQIHDALSRSPDIISMSAGGYTRDNVPSLAFQVFWEERLSQLGGVIFVSAAGNDARTAPFWPAAFPWCVGVGSMSRDGQRRSWFSNYGAWVDVYAPGEDIVNAYARLKYMTVAGTVRDTSAGIVKWSGTSFATPIVSGLIAARMSRTGETGRLAADALLAAARSQFRPGVGPRLFP